ncbi:hypothetical protein CI109_102298 [Kwoniella shandongensis]|uniref:Uncharacterized protein n=1 Tax=Kwoniella shandongensis TaxID=1734106 RepID=A0A5M6BNS4_9TREE|nr:uncharacterized protein CI109_007128 [Kwoniella shandongensis]KAA5524528.1 hypothetical protein CI109_007128 [Kwoniella shandongensis]
MPRLQILQHKSYHPYLEKNKQRVREDEARAAAEELAREQKRVDNEAEARLDILRRRAGSPSFQPSANDQEEDNLPSTSTSRDGFANGGGSTLIEKHRKAKAREEKREKKKRDRLDFDFPSGDIRRDKGKEREKEPDAEREKERERGTGTEKWEVDGHLNFFADLERNAPPDKPVPTAAELAKKKKDQETGPFTMYLGRPERETKPWYADKDLRRVEDMETGEEAEERRARDKRKDARSKNRHDPLTQIATLLAPSPHKSQSRMNNNHNHNHSSNTRQLSERERALALIAKSSGTAAPPRPSWDDTPSTVNGGGRTWADDWERQKNKAGHRFYGTGSGPGPREGRGWEV